MVTTIETEAKFLLRQPGEFDLAVRTLENLGYSLSPRDTQTQVDRYFDTGDFRLLASGWACRHRHRGDDEILTLKSVGRRDGRLFHREEIDQPLPAQSSIPGEVPPGAVRNRLDRLVDDSRLEELFRVDNRRSNYELLAADPVGAPVELCLDRARIRVAGGRESPGDTMEFTELELELADGELSAIVALAAALEQQAGLLPSQLSKFERGLQVSGRNPRIGADMDIAAAPRPGEPVHRLLRRFLRIQLLALEREAPRALEGLLPEGVHQMRVALRRLRAVLAAAGRMLARVERVDSLKNELRWIERTLGAARDADVCGTMAAEHKQSLAADAADALLPFEQHMLARKYDAYAELAKALRSARYRQLLDELRDIVSPGRSVGHPPADGNVSIEEAFTTLVCPLLRDIERRRLKITRELPPRKLHRLRIRTKRLRYLLECFADSQPERTAKPLEAINSLLSLLGKLQDAVTLLDSIDGYATSLDPKMDRRQTLLALGRLAEREHQQATRCRKKFPRAWKSLANSTKPLNCPDSGHPQ